MQKLPVGKVAGLSYSLLFSEFPTLFRLTWLPLLVASALAIATAELKLWEGGGEAPAQAYALLPLPWPVPDVVSAFLVSVASMAVFRLVLFSSRRPGHPAPFTVDRPVLLFTGVLLAIGACWVAATAAGVLAVAALASSGWISLVSLAILLSVVPLIIGLILGFAVIRLIPVGPVLVAENRLSVGRSIALTRRNFWRLAGASLLVTVPLGLAFGLVLAVAGGIVVARSIPWFAGMPTRELHGDIGLQMLTWLTPMTPEFHRAVGLQLLLWMTPIMLLAGVVMAGLLGAFAGYSYLILSGKLDPDAVPSDAD